MTQRLRWTALALIAVTTIAACGGSDNGSAGDDAATTTAAQTDTSSTAAPSNTTSPETALGAGDGSSRAVVTIDGADYQFGAEGPGSTCDPDFFGGFFAVLRTEDLAGVFSIELWNPGTGDGKQTPTASFNMTVNGEKLDLEANPEREWPAAEAGTSKVDSFTYEGDTAQGSISFINAEVAYNADLAPLAPIKATFTVTCATG